MRKIVSYLHASLDGFCGGTVPWDLDWISYDQDLEAYAREVLSTADAVLWGRVTYEGMAQYWPSVPENPGSSAHERQHAAWLEQTEKVVVSSSLTAVTWNKTTLLKPPVLDDLKRLKERTGKDIVILGSPKLTHSLHDSGLIDEYRITISPIVLGEGVPLFERSTHRTRLELLESKRFASGVMGLHYRVNQGAA